MRHGLALVARRASEQDPIGVGAVTYPHWFREVRSLGRGMICHPMPASVARSAELRGGAELRRAPLPTVVCGGSRSGYGAGYEAPRRSLR